MLEDYIYEYVRSYINGEHTYILANSHPLSKDDINDLYMLQNMSENRKMEIAEQIVYNLKLEDKINELIHYYLYEKESE